MYIVITLILIIVILIYLANRKSHYCVEEQKLILCSQKDAFDKISNLKSWQSWSPWLKHEPDAKITFSDNYDQEKGFYQWQGNYVGEGKISHIKFEKLKSIEQKIEFIKPFKSKCKVFWNFEKSQNGTIIKWKIMAKMPWFLFFMTERMKMTFRQDFKYGLSLLELQLDEKVPKFSIDFQGVKEVPQYEFAYIKNQAEKSKLPETMSQDFGKLFEVVQKEKIKPDTFFAMYDKIDFKNNYFYFRSAFSFADKKKLEKIETEITPNHKAFQVLLTGGYENLEHAWSQAYSNLMMKKYKPSKLAPIEIYQNNPMEEKDSQKLKTLISIPVN